MKLKPYETMEGAIETVFLQTFLTTSNSTIHYLINNKNTKEGKEKKRSLEGT